MSIQLEFFENIYLLPTRGNSSNWANVFENLHLLPTRGEHSIGTNSSGTTWWTKSWTNASFVTWSLFKSAGPGDWYWCSDKINHPQVSPVTTIPTTTTYGRTTITSSSTLKQMWQHFARLPPIFVGQNILLICFYYICVAISKWKKKRMGQLNY